jgi:thiamine biosynthesis lipoprotein
VSELVFKAMGTTVVLRIDGQPAARAQRLLGEGRRFIEEFDAWLSRFRADSELSRVNADPRSAVEVSWLMGEFAEAAIWAARASDGLIDPTLTAELVRAGYGESRAGAAPAELRAALADAPARHAARPGAAGRWREIAFDRETRTLRRPAGVTLDSGGAGKGLAADLLARNWSVALGPRANFMVDCGGDIRFGPGGNRHGHVLVEDPFDDRLLPLRCKGGAVATTSIRNRIWRKPGGAPAHHLIDPSSGEPAWTGIAAVTALAPSALVAESLAKIAFLRGPGAAREVLESADGGLIVYDDGAVEYVLTDRAAVAAA